MARCEDWPACGHEMGCCPDFDPETGAQLNMVCVCGAKLPIDNPSSLCDRCLRDPGDQDQFLPWDGADEYDYPEEEDDLTYDDEAIDRGRSVLPGWRDEDDAYDFRKENPKDDSKDW